MIKLNNKLYSKLSYQVSFGDYQVKQNGKKRSGKAPYITFILDDFKLGLELVYDKKWIKELKINDKKDISKYVTDIIYNDSKGWISLIYGTYQCFLERIDNEFYLLDFYCNTIDDEEEFSIVLNEKINFILNHEEK